MNQQVSVSRPLSPLARAFAVLIALAILALTIAACGGSDSEGSATAATESESSSLSGEIAGAGASSQEAAMQAWVATFQGDNPDATISYDPIGSGGGREQFIAAVPPSAVPTRPSTQKSWPRPRSAAAPPTT